MAVPPHGQTVREGVRIASHHPHHPPLPLELKSFELGGSSLCCAEFLFLLVAGAWMDAQAHGTSHSTTNRTSCLFALEDVRELTQVCPTVWRAAGAEAARCGRVDGTVHGLASYFVFTEWEDRFFARDLRAQRPHPN